jgi:hypothetical protein
MKFAAIVAALSATALAAPAPEIEVRQDGAVNMMATAAPQWTITNMKRVCVRALLPSQLLVILTAIQGSGVCTWTFGIDNTVKNTPCTFKVKGSPATQTDSSGNVCGGYTVSSGWSGQFGAGNGFTTLAVVDNAKKQIIYPAYTDKQLASGKVVKPDRLVLTPNLSKKLY